MGERVTDPRKRSPGGGRKPKDGARQTERIQLLMTEAARAEIEAAVPGDEPVGRWIVDAALARARGRTDCGWQACGNDLCQQCKTAAQTTRSIPVADIMQVLRDLIAFPRAEVCRHYVAANLLSVLERNGVPVSEELARAVVESDDAAAREHLNRLERIT